MKIDCIYYARPKDNPEWSHRCNLFGKVLIPCLDDSVDICRKCNWFVDYRARNKELKG